MQSKSTMRLLGVIAVIASVAMLGTALAGGSIHQAASSPAHHRAPGVKPVYGGTLTLDLAGAFPHLDPARAYDTTSYDAVLQMYDQLVTYRGTSNDIVGDLASSFTVSPNGLVYTFHLRDAKFWNGQSVTADSFITEFERVLNPANQSGGSGFIDPTVVGSDAYAKGKAKTISGMQSLDGGKTLKITLSAPNPTFLYVLAMPFFSAVEPSYVNAHNEAYVDHNPMGTGAFELASYKPNQQWVLKKNPNYFIKGIPYMNEIVFNNDSSPESVLLHFEQGQTGLIGFNQVGQGIPSQDYLPIMNSQFRNDVYKMVQVSVNYIGLNTKYGPTANVKVRRALEYAIDKNALLRILDGRAIVANQPIPPSMPSGYNPNLPANATYSYNPTLAKKLLAEAGYPHGFTTTFYTDNSAADDLRTAQAVQQQLKNIGVTVNIDQKDWGTFLTNNEQGKQNMFTLAWLEDFPDPSDFLNTLFNSNQAPTNNSTNYSNKTVDALLNKAAVMPNGAARNALYIKAQNIIMSEAAWIPYAYPVFTAAVQPWLKGYAVNPNLTDPFKTMWIVKH